MTFIQQMLRYVRHINNTNFVQLVSLICAVYSIIQFIRFIFLKLNNNISGVKQTIVVLSILLLGVVFPISVLTLNRWSGWSNIALNAFALFLLFNFIMLLYIIKRMTSITKEKTHQNPTV